MLPDHNLTDTIAEWRETQRQKSLKNLLSPLLPKRFVEMLVDKGHITDKAINQLSHSEIKTLSDYIHAWEIKPNGTEGYRTAEVTLGGVDTDELSSKTFEAKNHKKNKEKQISNIHV